MNCAPCVRISLIACAVALAPVVGSATTLVGIWTEGKVTIATDSKQTVTTPAGESSRTVCKIYEADGLVFAFAGLAKAEEIDVVKSVSNQHPLTEMGTGKKLPVETLIVGADAALVKILKARHLTSDSSVDVGMLIAGMIDGKLQMVVVENFGYQIVGQFSLPQESRRFAYPDSRGRDGTDPNRGIEVVGLNGAIKRSQVASPDWSKGEDTDVAAHLITLETQDSQDSQYVGMPLSEVVVTEHGVKWISKGTCQ